MTDMAMMDMEMMGMVVVASLHKDLQALEDQEDEVWPLFHCDHIPVQTTWVKEEDDSLTVDVAPFHLGRAHTDSLEDRPPSDKSNMTGQQRLSPNSNLTFLTLGLLHRLIAVTGCRSRINPVSL
jgi:hypothetical protein